MSAMICNHTPAGRILVLAIGLLALLAAGGYALNMGKGGMLNKASNQDLNAPARLPAIVKTEDFDDWRLECREDKNCYIFQHHVLNDSKAPALRVTVLMRGDQRGRLMPFMRISTPLSVHLAAGLKVRIDQQKQIKLPFEFCGPVGCRVDFGMGGEFLSNLKAGEILQATYYSVPDGEIRMVNVSLKGFDRALAALSLEKMKD